MVVDTNCLSLNTVKIFEITSENKCWGDKIFIENIVTEVKLDTGAQINVMLYILQIFLKAQGNLDKITI